jgi:hypothetical protein
LVFATFAFFRGHHSGELPQKDTKIHKKLGNFSRSFGTRAILAVFPAINRRAIVRNPSGMMGDSKATTQMPSRAKFWFD